MALSAATVATALPFRGHPYFAMIKTRGVSDPISSLAIEAMLLSLGS